MPPSAAEQMTNAAAPAVSELRVAFSRGMIHTAAESIPSRASPRAIEYTPMACRMTPER